MNRLNYLNKAVELLKRKCNVIPEKYAMYNGAYLFLAYPPGTKDKNKYMNPLFLVDVKFKAAGPFSPAFDITGFSKATEKLISL